MSGSKSLAGRVAVVTGAGGGIGRAIAQSLAKRGCRLALVDVSEVGLAGTAAALGGAAQPTLHQLDVSDRAAVAALPDAVRAAHGGVDLLINNAGVALGGTFEMVTLEDFEWVMEINFWGTVRMTRAFLPMLHESKEARLVNMSSLFGLIALPGQAAYSASKFAVRGFSEVLRKELAGSRIGVTVIHPGGVKTSIAANARVPKTATAAEEAEERAKFQRLLRLSPERAGEIIVRGVEQRRDRVIVGADAKLASVIERIAPVSYFKIIGRIVQ